jgi:transcriptional regulator with XRE-family HTH domain
MSVREQILSFDGASPSDISAGLAARARRRRLDEDLTQPGLAARAGVTVASLRRFERTGAVSLENLIRIALALGVASELSQLFPPRETRTLDEILAAPKRRQRGKRT